MNWINPPETVRRFTVHQRAQHAVASLLLGALGATAALPWGPGTDWPSVHVTAGIAASAFFLYHVLSLLVIGIRYDVSLGKVAFLPGLRRGRNAAAGKYSDSEKGDYLAILAWAASVAGTGILLRWPGRLGVPGPAAYAWLRALHAGTGAALAVHVLAVHVPMRWLRASPAFRMAIWTGNVPLADVETRPGWAEDLVSRGVLVPAPREETGPEEPRESSQVRALLEEGNRHVAAGRFDEAARAFEAALVLFPDYSQARFNLGVARMKEGRKDLAAEQFRVFIESDPFNPMAGKARELLQGILEEGAGGGGR